MDARPLAAALTAILLWSALAWLGLSLAAWPPFLLVGCALVLGALVGARRVKAWRVPPAALALGVYGLFGFHFLLFLALRRAPSARVCASRRATCSPAWPDSRARRWW
jgi:hypothetical protein